MRTAFVRFIVVGALGFAVQIAVLAALTSLARWPWLPATAVAVETAVLHNYCWHEAWTWRGRRLSGGRARRLLRFHVGNGLGSIAGNLLLMWLLAGAIGVPPVAANVMAVATLAAWNFAVADRWVFTRTPQRFDRIRPCACSTEPR